MLSHLKAQLGDDVEISSFTKLSPGFSWVTYAVRITTATAGERRLIVRVAPPNGLFAPYSVLPQVYALQSFAGSPTPVPGLVSYAQDGAEIGCPVFVSMHVPGDTPAPWAASALDADHRRSIALQFIEILGHIHRFAWKDSPLSLMHDAGERPELRPIAIWRSGLARPTSRYYPTLDWGGRWLEANCPRPPRVTVVHGDYRIGNFLEQDRRITAILDWELVHVGDPHEDLAWALLPTFNGGSRKFYGVIDREEFFDLYEEASGICVSAKSFAYYEAFALYQAAAIQMRGVQAFQLDRFSDMRLSIMSSQMASIVRAFDRAVEAAS